MFATWRTCLKKSTQEVLPDLDLYSLKQVTLCVWHDVTCKRHQINQKFNRIDPFILKKLKSFKQIYHVGAHSWAFIYVCTFYQFSHFLPIRLNLKSLHKKNYIIELMFSFYTWKKTKPTTTVLISKLPLKKVENINSTYPTLKNYNFPLLSCDHTKKNIHCEHFHRWQFQSKIWQSDYCVRVNFVSSFNQFIDSFNVSYCMFN